MPNGDPYPSTGYKAKIISTIVDERGTRTSQTGYKAKIISTIVDKSKEL